MTTAPTTTASAITPAALPSAQSGRYIGVSPKTLANWRAQGIGPAYVRHGQVGGRVSYLVSDLDAYLESHRVAS